MKKLVLSVAVALVLCGSAVSCSKSESAGDMKAKIENCTNPDSMKVYVEQARAYASKLVAEGKVDEAKKYLAEIQPIVEKKAPALSGLFTAVDTALDKVEDVASDKTEAAKDAAAAAVDSAKSAAGNAVDAAAEKAGEVKDAAAEKAAEVKDAVSEKAKEAKDAVSEKAQEGADKVKDLLK